MALPLQDDSKISLNVLQKIDEHFQGQYASL
jgi:hypothetical protein